MPISLVTGATGQFVQSVVSTPSFFLHHQKHICTQKTALFTLTLINYLVLLNISTGKERISIAAMPKLIASSQPYSAT